MRSKLNLDQHFNPIITIRDAKYTLSKLHKVWGDKMQKKKKKILSYFINYSTKKKIFQLPLSAVGNVQGFAMIYQ